MPIENGSHDLYDEQGRSKIIPLPIETSYALTAIRPLWKGTLDDLTLIDNPLQKRLTTSEEFKILDKYIRLDWGENSTPIYIVDNHQNALYCWFEALYEEKIEQGADLIHYDDHSDASTASPRAPIISPDAMKTGNWELDDVVELVKKLACWGFIEPAIRSGLVGNFTYITPRSESYSYFYPKTDDSAAMDERSITNYIQSPSLVEQRRKIVDIDLDFFASKILNQEVQELAVEMMRRDIDTAGVVTFATSPGFIAQDRAIDLIRTLLHKDI